MIWRHDVDFSLQAAAVLARIDAEFDAKSTFFLRFRAETYNLFESENIKLVEEIMNLGHHIGLHFEPKDEDLKNETTLNFALDKAKNQLIEGGVSATIECFSFHNTTPMSLKFKNREYASLTNAYATEYMIPHRYSSDSGGYWRFDSIRNFLSLAETDRAQVLTHPEWWLESDMPPFSKIAKASQVQASQAMSKYEKDLSGFGLPLHKGSLGLLEEYSKEIGVVIPEVMTKLWMTLELEPLFAWLLFESKIEFGFVSDFYSFLIKEGERTGISQNENEIINKVLESKSPNIHMYEYFQKASINDRDSASLLLSKYVLNTLQTEHGQLF